MVLDALKHRKHVVLVNAELDSLIGPILKAKADEAGVVITHTDGDEPGVAMTLRSLSAYLGLRVVAAGNIKGMVDYYRNPDTQRGFAEKNDQDVKKVTSFADSTKLSMETTRSWPMRQVFTSVAEECMVPHASTCGEICRSACRRRDALDRSRGLRAWRRSIHRSICRRPRGRIRSRRPSLPTTNSVTGLSTSSTRHFTFRTFRSASTIGRAVIHHDATVAPIGGPVCEVVAVAKRDLKAGERLDGVGGFCTYGLIENRSSAREMRALPIGLSEGCVLRKDVAKDDVVSTGRYSAGVRERSFGNSGTSRTSAGRQRRKL